MKTSQQNHGAKPSPVMAPNTAGAKLVPLGYKNMSIYVDPSLSAEEIEEIKKVRILKFEAAKSA